MKRTIDLYIAFKLPRSIYKFAYKHQDLMIFVLRKIASLRFLFYPSWFNIWPTCEVFFMKFANKLYQKESIPRALALFHRV